MRKKTFIKKDIFKCKCDNKVARLITKDNDGNKGAVTVDFYQLTQPEVSSLYMRIPVPYDEMIHKKLIHFLRCTLNIPRCDNCGDMLAFFKTKPNPEKNGHNNPGNMPMDFYKITKEERYQFVLGLPVEYEALKHKPINHFANKYCKELEVGKPKKRREKVVK